MLGKEAIDGGLEVDDRSTNSGSLESLNRRQRWG
jgi:hypothetical protein